ncbi:unnamed protein product [Paramecium primaurelia]|uniref:Uncharacterized protein n=3 Tax=Paramecium TaxID=5884 RepID=A0C0V9_PARTE|nr:uncharacterized protein GSPATT00033902001 [Paramecium tetraurelia]CAD8098141.1 unnamed protein product [Paramecium primaurelia]CAD8189979.1 unnamed protein product [Paramecium pentaurelia]CAK64426.1 unnamed protein product [Paramecium tetraurelia]|eukprot:XP_001431824.1 hypothetical protein (macronuclear) [Paramecium tetraurelia strain d4-2]
MGCTITSEKVSQQKTMMMESTFNKEQREKEQRIKAHLILDEYRQTKTVRKQVKLQSDVKDALQEQLCRNKTATPQKSSIAN